MDFTGLSPNDSPVKNGESSIKDSNFGGNREHSDTSADKDYTIRTGSAYSIQENPIEETIDDIDAMANSKIKKNEFSRQENIADVQKNNESSAIQSDSDNRPKMDEGTDAVQVPETTRPKRHRKPNQWGFSSVSVYEGEIS